MFGSSIIDIAIGMVFVYLLLSLICSAANEIIERYSKKRASDLENGIKEMLLDDNMVTKLYNHPLVYSLYPNDYKSGAKNLPSYIPARNFALALMDLIGERGAQGATGPGSNSPAEGAMATLGSTIQANADFPQDVKKALLTFVDSSNNPAKVRENIENWFDSAMDRVSGVYKRRSQLIILLLGLAVTVALNVDTLALVRTLSTDRTMRDSLVAAAQEYAKNNPTPPAPEKTSASSTATPKPSSSPKPTSNPTGTPVASASASLVTRTTSASPSPTPGPSPECDAECRVKKNLDEIRKLGLPIGWTRQISQPPDPPDPRQLYGVSPQGWLMRILGWLLTALAISLGAPFWFDVLNKFIVVRSTVKPKEKSPEEKSKD